MPQELSLLANLLKASPSKGGLNASNYPAPYGLRAYLLPDGSYGGQMMPKYTGWLGPRENTGDPNTVSNELSIDDEYGDFPAMTPNLSPSQLARLLALKEGEKVPNDIFNTAREFALKRRAAGLNAFKDIGD